MNLKYSKALGSQDRFPHGSCRFLLCQQWAVAAKLHQKSMNKLFNNHVFQILFQSMFFDIRQRLVSNIYPKLGKKSIKQSTRRHF